MNGLRATRRWSSPHALGTMSSRRFTNAISRNHRRWTKRQVRRDLRRALIAELRALLLDDANPIEEGQFEAELDFLARLSDSLRWEQEDRQAEIGVEQWEIEEEQIRDQLEFFRALAMECMLASNACGRVTRVQYLMGDNGEDEDMSRSLASVGMHITDRP